jgi:hypothetical protein
MREDLQDARDKYVETTRNMLDKPDAKVWSGKQAGWSDERIKRHRQEIKPLLTRKTFSSGVSIEKESGRIIHE